jgi:hypothetical protein
MTWRRSFRPEPTGAHTEQAGFVPAMIVAQTAPTVSAAPASGRFTIAEPPAKKPPNRKLGEKKILRSAFDGLGDRPKGGLNRFRAKDIG